MTRSWIGLACSLLLAGCVTPPPPYDYSAFLASKPRSILVLPPVNHSPDVKASNSVLAQATLPLAESGYYVLPVALTNETFRQNGMTVAEDIHALPVSKLQQIFGADSGLYLDVIEYGTRYQVINSDTRVHAKAKLVDLRSGQVLWHGEAQASSTEQQNSGNNNLLGMLVVALVDQIANTLTDKGHDIAAITSQRLLAAGGPHGLLYGPYSPHYGQQKTEP